MRGVAASLATLATAFVASMAAGQTLTVPPPPPDCGSVVVVKCSKDPAEAAGRSKQDAARRLEQRRSARGAQEMDRIIIEGDSERLSPEDAISRALARPLVKPGETTFAVGEGAQCTCLNRCPPWPLPCCKCSGQPGSRHATSPGWKPTD